MTQPKYKAKLLTRSELAELVGPESATGVVRAGCSTEDWLLFEKHTREQGQPTKPNRANRRKTARLRQKAITRKRGQR